MKTEQETQQEVHQEVFETSQQAVQWITGLVSFGIKPGLSRMEWLMERLGHPQRRLKFIHIAGTNGKGSTAAMISTILHECGYDTGTFTSPYMEKFADRIQMNGNPISDEDLLELTNQLKPLADELAQTSYGSPTMFEISTALAILYFARKSFPTYVVWEAGLGGRLDSTNIVHPILSVITNIGHDHMDVLGDSLKQVATEKAGIMKPGIPVVTTEKSKDSLQVLEQHAQSKKTTLYQYNEGFYWETQDDGVRTFHSPFRTLPDLRLSLRGAHQWDNAAAALMTIEILRQYMALLVDEDDVRNALSKTRWPGRLELIQQTPRVLLDGAHNPEGVEALVKALKSVYSFDKLHIMIGMLESKNHRECVRHILPITDTLVVTEPNFRKKLSSDKLAEIVQQEISKQPNQQDKTTLIIEPDWKQGLRHLLDLAGDHDLLVVTGTLYMVSDVRSWIISGTETDKGW